MKFHKFKCQIQFQILNLIHFLKYLVNNFL